MAKAVAGVEKCIASLRLIGCFYDSRKNAKIFELDKKASAAFCSSEDVCQGRDPLEKRTDWKEQEERTRNRE